MSVLKFSKLAVAAILCLSNISFARGGSHTSSGGNFIINRTTNEDINSFLHDSFEWDQLIWLQKTLIDDLHYLVKSNLIDTENNFFAAQMGEDKEKILQQIKTANPIRVFEKLSVLFDDGRAGGMRHITITPENDFCISEGKKVSSSIRYDFEKKSYIVCVDYADLKKNSNKETFQLHLTSLLTHELVHIWNRDLLDATKSDYEADKEILPKYFQRLILSYFSYTHHIKARNSIHKFYSWVSEIRGVLYSFKTSWESALDVEQRHQMSGVNIDKGLDIHRSKIDFLCKSYLRDSVFPSELVYNLNVIQSTFLKEGLVEVPMGAFSHLTNAFQYLVVLKYYCYVNSGENSETSPTPLKVFFDSVRTQTVVSSSVFTNVNKVLAEQFPGQRILPPTLPINTTSINVNDSLTFRSILEQILVELDFVYFSQKSIPALM